MSKNGLAAAMPNPSVGAVLVHNNRIIGEGYTSAYGGAHAEVHAIAFAKAHTPELLTKATLYVSLEPCSHHGKTPPCANLIIESGIKHVVIGCVDPFAKVAGAGIKKLQEAGCRVETGVLEEACVFSHRRFFTFHQKKRPYIILKWAQSNDGYIAPKHKTDRSPVWISNRFSRQLVHKWRSEEMAILVGAQTVLDDNPSLTTRDWHGKSPLRVVIDSRGNLPDKAAVFDDKAPTLRISTTTPERICHILFEAGIQSVIIEGGAKTLTAFIDADLWDEARVFTGHISLGDGVTAPSLPKKSIQTMQEDIMNDTLIYYQNKSL